MFLPVFPHFYAKRVNCSHHSSLSCSLFLDISPLDRVGNSLFGFLSRWLVFCERKSEISIRSWKRVNRSCRTFVMSNRSKLIMVTLL